MWIELVKCDFQSLGEHHLAEIFAFSSGLTWGNFLPAQDLIAEVG